MKQRYYHEVGQWCEGHMSLSWRSVRITLFDGDKTEMFFSSNGFKDAADVSCRLLLFTRSRLNWLCSPAALLMTTCKSRSNSPPAEGPTEDLILRKYLHKETQNWRQQRLCWKCQLLHYNPNKSTLPWQEARCGEESASEQSVCQVGIYRAAEGCSKGDQWTAHCGPGRCDITG